MGFRRREKRRGGEREEALGGYIVRPRLVRSGVAQVGPVIGVAWPVFRLPREEKPRRVVACFARMGGQRTTQVSYVPDRWFAAFAGMPGEVPCLAGYDAGRGRVGVVPIVRGGCIVFVELVRVCLRKMKRMKRAPRP